VEADKNEKVFEPLRGLKALAITVELGEFFSFPPPRPSKIVGFWQSLDFFGSFFDQAKKGQKAFQRPKC
jgi:hypothetical protein